MCSYAPDAFVLQWNIGTESHKSTCRSLVKQEMYARDILTYISQRK